jgi:metal-responsive CopG/Arc/MetJ family transcriptional regulator
MAGISDKNQRFSVTLSKEAVKKLDKLKVIYNFQHRNDVIRMYVAAGLEADTHLLDSAENQA